MNPSEQGAGENRSSIRNLELAFEERRRRRTVALVALVAAAAAAGAGVFAWTLWRDREAGRAQIAKLDDSNRALTDALELHRASKLDLDTRLSTCKKDLQVEKSSVAGAATGLALCQATRSDLEQQQAEAESLASEFEKLTARFQKMIDGGKLDVVFRRGQMVVKLPAKVLFPSGSATLSKQGTEALAEVATVLRTMRDRRFFIAGHTDNVPISGALANNWELSTARAVRVTTMLIEKGVRPRGLAAAGYGQYMPVASNKSEAGRRKNRRIEIILEPDLRKLPIKKLVGKSGK